MSVLPYAAAALGLFIAGAEHSYFPFQLASAMGGSAIFGGSLIKILLDL